MGFVRTSGQDDDAAGTEVGAGAPPFPGEPDNVDWADPELVKVHYDVSHWSWEQRAELAESLAERNVPHRWEADDGVDELVVPESAEAYTDALFEELEAELGPFPVPLAADEPGTVFDLSDWGEPELENLRAALIESGIAHRWDRGALVVAPESQDDVDDLLDAIEAGEVASADGEGAPDGALHDLYAHADELARDPDDAAARQQLTELVGKLAVDAPPYGLAVRAWAVIVNHAEALVGALAADDGDAERVATAAAELRAVTRPYV